MKIKQIKYIKNIILCLMKSEENRKCVQRKIHEENKKNLFNLKKLYYNVLNQLRKLMPRSKLNLKYISINT